VELADATVDGTRKAYLADLGAVPLLIIDDLGRRKLPHTAAEDLRAGVDRLAAYVKKLPKETIVEPMKKAGKARGKNDTDKKRTSRNRRR
jgi:DNA replication protein DnaC